MPADVAQGVYGLYQLGAIQFWTTPMEVHEVTREEASDYAAKDVLQSAKPREWVGEGDTTLRMVGTMFPTRIGGGPEYAALEALRMQHEPQLLMRGDGVKMGYYFLVTMRDRDTHINAQGIGRVKEYEFHLVRSPYGPDAVALPAALYGLLS